ncbi:MAG: AsmA family protein, partial [Pseudomonadota bacterium]|nr:AsmA family protein [Pseudomonadota bacterium]
MTIDRKTGLILAATATLLGVVAFFVPRLLDANRYRAKAIAYLEESTGKKIEIGRLTITFFPTMTLHVDDFGIKSPPLFPPSYILKVARIDARLDPWTLL